MICTPILCGRKNIDPTTLDKERNKKGVSSKGEGRGNGLYFASKMIGQNQWLSQSQEIIDNYYIQQLFVYKSTTKKRD